MTDPGKEVLQALTRLRGHADFRVVLAWCEASRSDQQETNDNLQGVELYRGQGRSLELKDFLDAAENPASALRELAQQHAEPAPEAGGREPSAATVEENSDGAF